MPPVPPPPLVPTPMGILSIDLHELQNEQKDTNSRASEPSRDKGQLKRNVRYANNDTNTLSATEINNALSEIIELKQILHGL